MVPRRQPLRCQGGSRPPPEFQEETDAHPKHRQPDRDVIDAVVPEAEAQVKSQRFLSSVEITK